MGPGENAGAVDVGDGLRGRVQGRVAQPPERRRAVPGRRDRRRRDPPRRLRARRAADRGARLAALRRARLGALALPVRPRRRRDRPLRQLDRGADGRRRGLLRGALRAQLPRQRDVRRRSRAPTAWCARRRRASATWSCCWAPRPGATESAAPRCSPRPSSRTATRSAPASRSATRSRSRSCSSAASSCSTRGLLVSLQDLGAAGLTSSARRDGVEGRRRDRDRRRAGAAARTRHGAVRGDGLRVAGADARGRRARRSSTTSLAVCERWQTGAAVIGEVTDSGRDPRARGGEVVGDVPVEALVDGCPLYDLEPAEPEGWIYPNARLAERVADGRTRSRSGDPGDVLLALLASPNIASKRWAFEQYDSIVGSRTVRRPETADAAVLRLLEAGGAIAVSIDGNGRRVACDPYRGHGRGGARVRRRTSPASARSRWASPTASTSATPRSRRVAWQLDRSVAGARRRLRARSASRSSAATSRSTTRPSAGRSTRRRSSAWSASCPTRRGRAALALRDGDAIALVGPVRALARRARSWRSCAASSAPACPASTIDAVARRDRAASARRCARGAIARRPRRQRRRPRLRARRVRDRRRGRRRVDLDALVELRGGSGETACSARARAASSSPARRGRSRRSPATRGGVDVLVIGEAGGERIEISAAEASLSVAVADAERAWRSLADRLAAVAAGLSSAVSARR